MKKIVETIHTRSIRCELLDQIRDRISTLAIAPDRPIREADLAKQAGVSRTPVRESLLMLEAEGFVDSKRSQGFTAKSLTAQEICEIHPILATLECLALRESLPFDKSKLSELSKLNKTMKSTKQPKERLRIDEMWHALLLSGCQNRTLQLEIGRMKALIRRYSIAFLNENGQIDVSAQQHETIIARLKDGRIANAARELKRNWATTYDQVSKWMESFEE